MGIEEIRIIVAEVFSFFDFITSILMSYNIGLGTLIAEVSSINGTVQTMDQILTCFVNQVLTEGIGNGQWFCG